MSTDQLADAQHPWIGLAPFTESDREFFAGRGEEIDELLRLVRRDTLTLLYGVSGLGKTSLLQAGLFRALRAEDYLPVPIRLDYVDGAATLAKQVLSAITKASDAASVEAPVPLPGETLWEYFHRESNHFWSPRNDLVTPFLVFDQFEECFTLGRETAERERRGAAFISELADLVENRPPAALRGDPQRAREFSFKTRPLKVLLAMREDYLAELDRIRSQFRALGQNRLRLLPMDMPQAREVIDLGAQLMAPGVEDRIVRFVAGSAPDADDGEITVAPALLSLVLQQLNERRLEQGTDAKITAELLDRQQKKIFEDFYLRTLKHLAPGVRTFIEDRLLTASGFRNSCALDDALSCPGVTQPVLDELVNSRLLAYEDRHRVRRVEITHDVLAPVIRISRDSRISREALAKAERQKAEAQAKEQATRKQLIVVGILLILAVVAAIYGWFENGRANAAKDNATKLLHDVSESDVDSADAVGQSEEWAMLPEWAKRLVFLKRAASTWLENPDAAARLWAQLRHDDASRAPLLKWVATIPRDAKMAWKPKDGILIATVSPTGLLQLWDTESGKISLKLDDPDLKLSRGTWDMRFSSDGDIIILRHSNELWRIISREPEKLKVIFKSENAKLLKGEPISPDGKKAISRSNADGSVSIISTLPGRPETVPLVGASHQDGIVAWAPNGARIAVSFDPQTIDVYDASSGRALRNSIKPSKNLRAFSFDSSGKDLLINTSAHDPRFEIWHTETTETAPIDAQEATFAVWFHDSEKVLWNVQGQPRVHAIGGAQDHDVRLSLSDAEEEDISENDSVSLVRRRRNPGSPGSPFQVFDLETGRASTSLAGFQGWHEAFLSPDSTSVALTGTSGLSRWEIGPNRRHWQTSRPGQPVPPASRAIAPSPGPILRTESHRKLIGGAGSTPKWKVKSRLYGITIQSGRSIICSIPLEKWVSDPKWIEDGRKLRVVSPKDRTYADIEWDPPDAVEEPILGLVRLVVGYEFNEKREMVPIPDKERIELRNEMPQWQGRVKDPRWQKLLDWWNRGRLGD